MSCPLIALSPTWLPGSLSFTRLPWAGWACPPALSTLDRLVPPSYGFPLHSGSGRGEANFLHSGYYGAMFSVCAGNSVDNTRVGVFCCWAALVQCHQHRGWSAQELGRTHTWGRWPQLTRGISHTIWCIAQCIVLWKEKGKMPRVMLLLSP